MNNPITFPIKESAKQNVDLQEKSKKQTVLLKAESSKLTTAVESLMSEIKGENEKRAKILLQNLRQQTIKLGINLR